MTTINIAHHVELKYDSDWIPVTSDVLLGNMFCDCGIIIPSQTQRIGQIGRLQFTLDNSHGNSAKTHGLYSPGHANARTGFNVGTPVRWVINEIDDSPLTFPLTFPFTFGSKPESYYKFSGKIEQIDIAPDEYGAQVVNVTAADWFKDASQIRISSLPAQVGKTIDGVVEGYFSDIEPVPDYYSLETGANVFSYAGAAGGSETALLSELRRLAESEPSYIYMRGGRASEGKPGSVLVVENKTSRDSSDVEAVLSDKIVNMKAGRDWDDVYNDIFCTVHPTAVDTDTVRIYELQEDVEVPAGQTVTFSGRYQDSDNPDVRVGAYDINPVSDYTIALTSDGQGDINNLIGNRILEFGSDLIVYWRMNSSNGLPIYGSSDLVVTHAGAPGTASNGAGGWNYLISNDTNDGFYCSNPIAFSTASIGSALYYYNPVEGWEESGAGAKHLSLAVDFSANTSDNLSMSLIEYTGTDGAAFYVHINYPSVTSDESFAITTDQYGTFDSAVNGGFVQFGYTWDFHAGTTDWPEVNFYFNATPASLEKYAYGQSTNIKPEDGAVWYLAYIGGAVKSMLAQAASNDMAYHHLALFDKVLAASDFAYINSGTNATVDYSISAGGTSPQFTAVNNLNENAYILETSLYGKLLTDLNPITIEAQDTDSQRVYGKSVLDLDMTYQDAASVARQTASDLLADLKDPNTRVDYVEFIGNHNSDTMTAFLNVEPGDRVAITEEMTGLATDEFIVNGVQYVITSPDITNVRWIVYPA